MPLIALHTFYDILSQVGEWMSSNPYLKRSLWNIGLLNPFARIFAYCPWVEMYGVHMIPLSSFSLIKCWSISMCFVQSCWFRLWAILIADLLSQYSLIGPCHLTLRYSRIPLTHKTSHMPWAIAWNSDSTLDLVTTCYFLLCQEMRLPPRKVQYSKVEHWSVT